MEETVYQIVMSLIINLKVCSDISLHWFHWYKGKVLLFWQYFDTEVGIFFFFKQRFTL